MPLNGDGENKDPRTKKEDVLLERLILFSQSLREHGFLVSPSDTLEAAHALMFIDLSSSDSFYNALKTTLVKKSEYYSTFDLLFQQFWLGRRETGIPSSVNPAGRIRQPMQPVPKPKWDREGIPSAMNPLQMMISDRRVSKETLSEQAYGIYSPLETLARKDFRNLSRRDTTTLKRGLRTFAKRMATREGRRFTPSSDGRLDFRRTFRASLKSGGHLTDIFLADKKVSKSRLVFLCDISGSMDLYSGRLLKLIYFACNTIPGTKVFGFSTRLVSLNKYLQGKSLPEAAQMISENVNIWSSGTRIGSVLGLMLSRHPGDLRSSTVVVIISDGWEIGDLDMLRRGLSEIRRHVSAIVWLNPQADSPGYSPLAAGMNAALPYVDFFSGLDIITDKREFERVLGRAIYASPIVKAGRLRKPIRAN